MCRIIEELVNKEREKTIYETHIKTANRMIEMGIDNVKEIADITLLPIEKVEELIKERSA